MANEQATPPARIPTVSPSQRFTPETIAKLDAPLNPARVAKDYDGNPYLEGWDAIACANAYFGFDGWTSDVLHIGIAYSIPWAVGQGDKRRECEIAVYQARIAIEAGGVRKVDIGSSITADDSPRSHETAAKGAVTDALKRALRQFGSQFGNDLYDKGRTGHELGERLARELERPQAAQTKSAAPETAPAAHDWKDELTARAKKAGVTSTRIIAYLEAPSREQFWPAVQQWTEQHYPDDLDKGMDTLIQLVGEASAQPAAVQP